MDVSKLSEQWPDDTRPFRSMLSTPTGRRNRRRASPDAEHLSVAGSVV